jgi:hypothetical protein
MCHCEIRNPKRHQPQRTQRGAAALCSLRLRLWSLWFVLCRISGLFRVSRIRASNLSAPNIGRDRCLPKRGRASLAPHYKSSAGRVARDGSRQRRGVQQPSAALPPTPPWFLILPTATACRRESARGLAHSKTWRHLGRFVGSSLFLFNLLSGHGPGRAAPQETFSSPALKSASASLPARRPLR